MSDINWDDLPDADAESPRKVAAASPSTDSSWDDLPDAVSTERKSASSDFVDSLTKGVPFADREASLGELVQKENDQKAKQMPKVGKVQAATDGLVNSMSFDFADDIGGAIMPAVQMAGSAVGVFDELPTEKKEDGTPETTYEKYMRLKGLYTDTSRETTEAAQEQQPVAYNTGMAAGALAGPGLGIAKVGQLAAKGITGAAKAIGRTAPKALTNMTAGATTAAGGGFVSGMGQAEGDFSERLPQAIDTAKSSAVVGAALPAVYHTYKGLQAMNKGARNLPFAGDVLKAQDMGVEGKVLTNKEGRRALEAPARAASDAISDDVNSVLNRTGKAIQKNVTDATEAGKNIDLSDIIPESMVELRRLSRSGSDQQKQTAAQVISDVKDILGIKDVKVRPKQKGLPEGMDPSFVDGAVPDAAEELQRVLQNVTPEQAHQLQQVLRPITESTDALAMRATQATGKLRSGVVDKLGEVTGNTAKLADDLPSLNETYKATLKIRERLKADVGNSELPEEAKDRVFKLLSGLDKEGVTPAVSRQIMSEVTEQLSALPGGKAIVKKFETLSKALSDYDLAQQVAKGTSSQWYITPKAGFMMAANKVGQVRNSISNAASPLTTPIGKAADAVTDAAVKYNVPERTFGAAVMQSSMSAGNAQENRKKNEPHRYQQQVAKAAENADPEVLMNQAQVIRNQHGGAGERLATMLENLSGKDKNARRALMFTIMQDPQHRKMLGLRDDDK